MRRVLFTLGWVVVLSLLFTGAVLAQSEDEGQAATGEVALLLAPLIAAATAVERIIDMIFNWYESIVLNVSSFSSQARGYLGWARGEVSRLQKELLKVQKNDLEAVVRIEDQLETAENRLMEFLKSPTYVSRKKTLSVVLGIVIGLILSFTVQIKMFGLLGITLPWAWADMLVTGLVIGTGSAPVHSVIGLLQNTKDAVDQARALWSGKAFNQAQAGYVQSIQAAQMQSMASQQAAQPQVTHMAAEEAFGPTTAEQPGAGEAAAATQVQVLANERAMRRRIKGILR